MNRCPITYELCSEKYSKSGLKQLSSKLQTLNDFPYTAQEQVMLAAQYASKISIQGVQPKLSVKFNVAKAQFEIVEQGGTFILKPPHQIFPELPQNEDVTMRMAKMIGIEVPFHGLIYTKDGSLTYFIKRFDRIQKGHKIATEDFSQLLGFSRETKYDSSMEQIIKVIEQHCTFPLLEKMKLFRIIIFNFLVGNEDMHLKNFSLIRRENKVELSPAYDLLNSSIVIKSGEEIALPLRGKKSNLKREDFVEYYGSQRLGLTESLLFQDLSQFKKAIPLWIDLLNNCFLSEKLCHDYLNLLQNRAQRLQI